MLLSENTAFIKQTDCDKKKADESNFQLSLSDKEIGMKHIQHYCKWIVQILISITVEFQLLVLLLCIYGNLTSVGQNTSYRDPDCSLSDFYTVKYNESINYTKFSYPEKGGKNVLRNGGTNL